MLIYRNDGKLFCISKKALQLAGYHDIEHFNAEHNDYSELFVKRPGYIYNFENFSWLSFLRNANEEQKRVMISTKDNATYECELSMETVYPVEFDENTPEFFYQIEFKNLKLANGAGLYEDFEEVTPDELAFEEKILDDAYTENKTVLNVGVSPKREEKEKPKPFFEEEKEEEPKDFDFSLAEESPSVNTPVQEEEKPLELVDFEFGATEQQSEEKQETQEEPEELLLDTAAEKSPLQEEPLSAPEIGLKIEPEPQPKQSEEPLFFETPAPEESPIQEVFANEPATDTSVSQPQPEEPSIEMPDIRKVSSTLGLPETMVKAFIKEFVTTYMNDLPEVKAAIVSNNPHIVKKEAIKLKGIAANLRMDPLTNTLEAVLGKRSKDDLEEIWNRVDSYIHALASLYVPELVPEQKKPESMPEKRVYETDFDPFAEEPIEVVSVEEKKEEEPAEGTSSKLKLEEKDTGETIIFDPNEAADALGLPESLILEFVNDFIEQARDEMTSFEEAYEKGDINTINEVAHKLKGVAANLRIEDMRQLMENVQHAQNPKEVEKELIDFYHKLAALTKMMAKEYA